MQSGNSVSSGGKRAHNIHTHQSPTHTSHDNVHNDNYNYDYNAHTDGTSSGGKYSSGGNRGRGKSPYSTPSPVKSKVSSVLILYRLVMML